MTTRHLTDFLGAVGGRAINTARLAADAPRLQAAGADVRAVSRAADLDGDGWIRGDAELRAAFRAADRFDRNGQATSVIATDAQGRPTTAGLVLSVLEQRAVTPPPATVPATRDAAFQQLLAQARREGSNPNHLAFLDRGLSSSPFRATAPQAAALFRKRTDGLTLAPASAQGALLFPARGQPVASTRPLPFLGASTTQASVAVLTDEGGAVRARWYGREERTPSPMWSSSKSVNALALIARLNTLAPGEKVADLRVQEAGRPETAVRLGDVLQDIASYDAGVPRSNAAAGLLGRLLGNTGRDAFVTSTTGGAGTLHGGYGGGTVFSRPEVVTASGQRVLLSPVDPGPAGKNRVTAETLTRLHAQAALHTRLSPDQRIAGAQQHSLDAWTTAMTEDPARYADVALSTLGLAGVVRDVAISSKLGFGYVPETNQYEAVYSGVMQFTDPRANPPKQRTMAFTLRGEGRDPVALDASLAADMTELVRRLADGTL